MVYLLLLPKHNHSQCPPIFSPCLPCSPGPPRPRGKSSAFAWPFKVLRGWPQRTIPASSPRCPLSKPIAPLDKTPTFPLLHLLSAWSPDYSTLLIFSDCMSPSPTRPSRFKCMAISPRKHPLSGPSMGDFSPCSFPSASAVLRQHQAQRCLPPVSVCVHTHTHVYMCTPGFRRQSYMQTLAHTHMCTDLYAH